ncbi:sortase A [Nocardioides terrae]|uniref:Sortase A n=2 Tax=Nocardioides terrae TaxID=574651 RepID=A0A1I1EZL9_9ACTN|nr:class E sortase [Nocardioides terrae]SFB92092.1 sortase A [Nocardioides terrae]
MWPGLVLACLGVVLLGYVGWEYAGTNVVSHHRHHDLERRLHESWATGHPSVRTKWGKAEALVRIPRFGAGYRVPVLEGTDSAALASGFGHYEGTAGPGEAGNYALAAHRVTHGEPLRDMPDLREGDEVVVETATATYTYRLVTGGTDLVVSSTATWVTDPVPRNPTAGGAEPPQDASQHLLTLTTCSELFHTDDRTIVFGVLVGTVERDAAAS